MQSKGSQKKWNSKILLENYYWKIALILCVCKRYESWLVSIYVLESVWDSCEDTNGKMAQGYKEKKIIETILKDVLVRERYEEGNSL